MEVMVRAVSICVPCNGCIAFHMNGALRAGATRPELLETIGVAVLMGGGPAAAYGAQALEQLQPQPGG